MIQGILGKKIGMSQCFQDDGTVVPVTVIEAGPCTVVQVKTVEKDGYEAVQLGFQPVKRLNRPLVGHLKQNGLFRHLKEIPVSNLEGVEVGQKVDTSICHEWSSVDVIGISKGRGFQGTVKRHGFRGGPRTRGQSDRLRAPGSIGATTYPGRVLKGKKMAGHMGNERTTVLNLSVVQADPERNLLLVKGAVPGANTGLLIIRKSQKTTSNNKDQEAT